MAVSVRFSRPFLAVCLVAVVGLLLLILSPFLTPLLLATVVATLFHPSYRALNRRLGGRPGLAASLLCLLVTFLIVIPVLFLMIHLAGETQQALVDYQDQLQRDGFHLAVSERLVSLWNRVSRFAGLRQEDLRESMQAASREAALFLLHNSSAILAGFASVVADFFIMIFALFFLFRDGAALVQAILQLVPLSPVDKQRIVARFREAIYATFLGSFATALAQGAATWLLLWALDFQNVVLWGTLACFASFVPIVGAALVWVPASVSLVLRGLWAKAAILAACGALGISMLDNIVRPMVMRKTSQGIHTLLIFFSILGGVSVFGFSGLILGPVIMTFAVTILDLVKAEFGEADSGK